MKFKTFRFQLLQWVLSIFGLFLFLLFALRFSVPPARAGDGYPTPIPDCSITPTPTPTATTFPDCTNITATPYQDGEVTISNHDQPPDPYTARLGWLVFTPTPAPAPGTFPPGVIVIHGGGWHYGNAAQVEGACKDLAAAGYYVVSVAYELARCGYVQSQNDHSQDYNGSLPDDMVTRQTNDIKAFVDALRHDPNVNPNKIGVVGGSAGGAHALWVAFDTTDTNGNWPYWNAAARPQCVVTLSAPVDFSDRTPAGDVSEIDPNFILGTENYVNSYDLATLQARSPISLVAAPTQEAPFVPLFMANSWYDNLVPYHQMVDMICKLQSLGVPDDAYKTLTVPDSQAHSFALWDHWDGISQSPPGRFTVGEDVIVFLDAHLK